MEPLGVDPKADHKHIDEERVVRKRKGVQKAHEKAILYHSRHSRLGGAGNGEASTSSVTPTGTNSNLTLPSIPSSSYIPPIALAPSTTT